MRKRIFAAILAATGCGFYKTYTDACEKLVKYSKVLKPNSENVEFYNKNKDIISTSYRYRSTKQRKFCSSTA